MKKRVTKNEALYVARKLGIKFSKKKYTYKDFMVGMNVELEHGTVNSRTNVTNDDLVATGKITLAHLNEKWNYYQLLMRYVE